MKVAVALYDVAATANANYNKQTISICASHNVSSATFAGLAEKSETLTEIHGERPFLFGTPIRSRECLRNTNSSSYG